MQRSSNRFTDRSGRVCWSAYLLTVALWAASVLALAQPPATPVGVDAVARVPMSQTVPVIGRFVAPQSGVVAARSPGPVAEMHVNVGDHLQTGDLIAELDRARLAIALDLKKAELAELRARKKTAMANAKLAQQDLERIQKLRNTAAFARYDYDKRVQELAVAQASIEEADARIASGEVSLRLTEIEYQDGQIRAPFPGVVTLRHVAEGAWLRTGDPVVTVINDTDLEIEADVSAERLSGLAPGTPVGVTLGDGQHFQATVRAVVPDENPAARTRPVRFTPGLELAEQAIAVNQDVTLRLPASGVSDVLSVAKDAVLRRGPQAMVFVVSDGKAEPRPVQLGEAVGDRFQVLDGLQEGDLVVVRGNERLRPGQAVMVPGQTSPAADSEPAPTAEPEPDKPNTDADKTS